VARVVCEETYGPPPPGKPYACHDVSNGCIGKLCVESKHIRWCTGSENMMDEPQWLRVERSASGYYNKK
jgi:hypothetical protein